MSLLDKNRVLGTRMKDSAKDLGVSVTTISKALRNHPQVGSKMRREILARARELNYRPNFAARGLVTGRSYLVGLVATSLHHPFFAEIATCISDALKKSGYSLIVSLSDHDSNIKKQELDQLSARRLDALIIVSCDLRVELFFRDELQKTADSLVEQDLPGICAHSVRVDDEAAGARATEHLIDMGCRRIAHIGCAETTVGLTRLEGYRGALVHAGLEFNEDHIVRISKDDLDSKLHGAEAMTELLSHKSRPDGVVCFNDPLAIGAMYRILDSAWRIPDDIALIGCGDLYYDDSLRVPLSSIDQRIPELAQEAARIILRVLSGGVPRKPKSSVLQPRLVVRASTQRKEVGARGEL